MGIIYRTTVEAGGRNATGLVVPPEVVAALGQQKTPKVKVSINDHTWRGTVQIWEGHAMLTLSAENRQAAGVRAGDEVDVALELDTEPRLVEVPEALSVALAARPGATESFDALSYSKRKEMVRQVMDAKTEDTRNKRILAIVSSLEPA